MPTAKSIWLIIALVLLLRLPFLNQAIQGDDIYYLAGAQHAQLDPLHPSHARYVFLGKVVDMRGHPHPPLNAWFLGLLLAIAGDIREVPFHAAYILFSLIAALSMLWIAPRFTPRPLLATLLFLAVPPFVVNGASLESDLPFLAFFLLAVAAYCAQRAWLAFAAACLASLAAYQGILLAPILLLAPVRKQWPAILAPVLAIGGFQLFERYTSGALPAAVLSGYMTEYGWQQLEIKLKHFAALSGHLLCTLVFPLAWFGRRGGPAASSRFLWLWIAIYFAAVAALGFAGSARYLLPLAAPVCMLVSTSRLAAPSLILQAALALAMAIVNYQHWDGIRQFARTLPLEGVRRVFVNGEWGLRFYMEERGAIPLELGQRLRAGDLIVSTAYVPPPTGNLVKVAEKEISSSIPVRIIGVGSRSAYSSIQFGLLPYGLSTVPMDRLRADRVVDFQPTLSYLRFGGSPAEDPDEGVQRHLVHGFSPKDRWTLQDASLMLKPLPGARTLFVKFYIPASGAGRQLRITLDGAEVLRAALDQEGIYERSALVSVPDSAKTTIALFTDKPLRAPNDQRLLGVILLEIGFRP